MCVIFRRVFAFLIGLEYGQSPRHSRILHLCLEGYLRILQEGSSLLNHLVYPKQVRGPRSFDQKGKWSTLRDLLVQFTSDSQRNKQQI